MTELSDAALDYLRAGLHILALEGKKPNARVHGDTWSWEDSFWGTPTDNDVAQIERAFDFFLSGTTGIAILIPPGFLVADVDSDRAAELLLSIGFQATDETIAAQTKNGLHVWFFAPGQERNRWLGDGQYPNPGRTLLFKGLGGYVVAPPSEHPDGGQYTWITPLVQDGLAQMPDTIPAEAIRRFTLSDQWGDAKVEREQAVTFTVVPGEGPWWTWEKVWDYQTGGLEKAIENAADGNQNNVIHWAAMTAREEGVPYEVAMERLLAAAVRGNHPRTRARDTIRGAYKRG